MDSATQDSRSKLKLLDRLREALGAGCYSRRTEETYCRRVRRYMLFHNDRPRRKWPSPRSTHF